MPVLTQTENVAEFLLQDKRAGSPALVTLSGEYSYEQLRSAVRAVAQHLAASGGRKGDRAILAGDNSFFWVVSYLGALQAGLVCVPLPTATTEAELHYAIRMTEARFAFVQNGFRLRNGPALCALPVVVDKAVNDSQGLKPVCLDEILASSASRDLRLPTVQTNDLATLMFTSGSTGTPRAVMVTHGNIMANTDSIVECLRLSEKDRIMDVLPFHYCFGTSLLHTHLRAGGSVVIDNRFMYPEKVLDRMIETECTGFAGVPSHYQILLSASSLRTRSFPHLRYLQQAGGHLPSNFIRDLQDALPGKQVFIMYGQTEATARLSCVPPERLQDKIGSIGKGIPGVKLRVLTESGSEVGPGETGEVVAEGDNVTLGYWRDAEETEKCFRDGRLYTGDLAVVDEEGFIFIVDRAKDFLKCGGKRVSCRQIEQQILQFDELTEAAVIGIPDELLGEAVKAFVVPKGPTPDLVIRLQSFCKERMPAQVVPKQFVVLDSLPKTSAGKISKQTLKAL